MRTFAPKQNQPQRRATSNLSRSNKVASGASHRAHPILHLQRTIGNQAVQRLLQANPEGLEVESGTTAPTRFAHDFSQIPVYSKVPVKTQTKLTVSTPGDVYEQEADRVANQVMRVPDSQLQHACACGGSCPKCRSQTKQLHQQQEHLQTKNVGASNGGMILAPPIIAEASRSPGQPLGTATRNLMESRFGHDFSQVRVHTDGKAVESARKMNALAYTMGRDIVFGAGQYQPGTTVGRRLLAHELTHVVQQSPDAVRPLISSGELAVTPVRVEHRTPTVGALVQRAIKCSLDHIEKECKGAASSCMSVQESYCKDKYPTSEDIKTLHTNAVTAAEAKKKGLPHAADNLLHFLDASGTEKVMPVKIFQSHKATKDQLTDRHRIEFIEGAEKRLGDGKLKAGGSVEMVWTDTASAFTGTEDDLGLSVGGYTLCSKVKVSATDKGGGTVELTFDKWTVQAFDCYNWDPGKLIGALFGDVSDSDLCCLENAAKGKHFRVRTDPWKNTHAPSIAKATISASKSAPSKSDKR